MLPLALLVVAGVCGYLYLKSRYSYWKARGVPCPQPSIFFGNIGAAIFAKKSFGDVYRDIYNGYKSLRYVGFYKVRQPGIVLNDTELIREVLVKHFNNFHENEFKLDEKTDPLLVMDPFFQDGERWKENRNKLTPALTNKQIKSMYPLMEKTSQGMVSFLESAVPEKGVEAKELAAKYTTDTVTNCAFGLDANSFESSKARFAEIGRKIMRPSFFTNIKIMLAFILPVLGDKLNIKLLPTELALYFRNVIGRAITYRRENNITRNDFLDMMTELQGKLGTERFPEIEVSGLAMTFFINGYETSATVLSYTLYELALNLDIQNKLREEIEAAFDTNGGKLDYEIVSSLPYLVKVVNENLRKNPPIPNLGKICTEPFDLPSPDGQGPNVTIEKNTLVVIPVVGLHSDPKYFPNPDKFDPERFSKENRESIPKFAFLPFGEGPRMCPGIKFAVTQVKVALAYLIKNFEVRTNKRTIVPLQVDTASFLLAAKGGIWLNFYKVKK